VGGSAGQGWSG